MSENFSLVKKRVLQFAETQKVSKEKFFADFGISYANFRGKSLASAVNSVFLEKICASYPSLSAEWLLRGSGSMLLTSAPTTQTITAVVANNVHQNVASRIEDNNNADYIETLKARITELETDKRYLQKQVDILTNG